MIENNKESPTKFFENELSRLINNNFDLTKEESNLLVPNIVQIVSALVNMVTAERKALEKELARWADEGGNVAQ